MHIIIGIVFIESTDLNARRVSGDMPSNGMLFLLIPEEFRPLALAEAMKFTCAIMFPEVAKHVGLPRLDAKGASPRTRSGAPPRTL